jgi:hypothetical protein
MIAIRTVATKDVDLEPFLERPEIINCRPNDSPERFDVTLQRFGLGQRRLEQPHIFPVSRRTGRSALAFAMKMGRLNAKPLGDLLKGQVLSINAQRRTEAKVILLVRLFAVEEAPQRAKHSWSF